jgi:hypothetical protein
MGAIERAKGEKKPKKEASGKAGRRSKKVETGRSGKRREI